MIETLKNVSAMLLSLVALGGIAWGFGETTGYRPWLLREQNEFTSKRFQLVMEQTQQNTLALSKSSFDILWGKREFGKDPLTFEEKVSLCKDAQILDYDVLNEEGMPECKDGQPVLIFKALPK